ncbi:hypothetical protein CCHR01_11321 [Colletotrichum chrysophilum]|uniref:Uncharacterized protein n=1 Tax=Colletotrichum chrysophilum TaxID=1836956 RepID=A0AAD9EEW2_9PEZI|nr:hypothetical protein CCHR01_11321 [Colletotrichum chrysophilum]
MEDTRTSVKFGDQSVASVKVQAITSITSGQAARYSHVLCLASEAVVTCGIALPLCGDTYAGYRRYNDSDDQKRPQSVRSEHIRDLKPAEHG